jgi:hypothetical protein
MALHARGFIVADKIKLVQGDTKPVVIVSLTDEETGAPKDLSGSTVRMYFKELGGTEILMTLIGYQIAGRLTEDGVEDLSPPYDVPGPGGRCQFAWRPGDLERPAGIYAGEIEIEDAAGGLHTVYDVLKFKIREDF